MAIKIRRKDKPGAFNYKSSKKILTIDDVIASDKKDQKKEQAFFVLEKYLLKNNFLSKTGIKKNPLKVWYEIGTTLNDYIKINKLLKDEEKFFWKDLYERETLLSKNIHKKQISESRNDYKIATFLSSKYLYKELESLGSWALVREIFSYKSITNDKRLINLVINKLIKNPSTRNGARPFIKEVSNKFKLMDTTILTDKELETKFNTINLNFNNQNE